MKYLLVLQWSATSVADFDALIDVEDELETGLPSEDGEVDGHDFGSNQMDIFVLTERPREAFRSAAALLSTNPRWASLRAAYRPLDGEDYVGLWPRDVSDFSVA